MQFTIIQDSSMSLNKLRVALRMGDSLSSIPLYCSWPFGVIEFYSDILLFHGPFVGRLAIQREEIVEISSCRSFISRYVRVKYRKKSSTGFVDIYSFKFNNLMAAISSWRRVIGESTLHE